ncbi:hypothetical protein [Propionispora vibrioides]|uniref:Uncharacterized protein n=1 Tax=Propionispora vibrioides TaxID=112903 RepID=A0A1H8WS88_9FIRM|nr:hypothetical protein [Propionispora vibrioides]SEP30515.1 hypothetical protein SAMN04490178_11780 [Propionispora vibrioides]
MMRFCPACGGRLPQGEGIRFCVHCGQKLAGLMPEEDSFLAAVAEPVDDVALPSVSDQAPLIDAVPQHASARRQVRPRRIVVADKPARPAAPETRRAAPAAGPGTTDEQYSVVLKTIADKERLIGRLSQVLSRGTTATRMAVELVPGVIAYKNSAAEIRPVLDILNGEGLYYTVIQGDFEMKLSLHEQIPDFARLDGALQQLLAQVPSGLWLGETVQFVCAEVLWENDSHVLVVTDQALYMINQPALDQPPAWRIIPFAQLANVALHAEDEELECLFKEYGREECLHIQDQADLTQVYRYLNHVLAK